MRLHSSTLPRSLTGRALPAAFAVAFAVAVATPVAQAAVTPYGMDMDAKSSTCLTGCTLLSSYTTDTDSAAAPFGSFANLAVSTAVADGGNAFAAQTSGSTTIDSDTQFTVQLLTLRPGLAATTGTYDNQVQASFSFGTGVGGGVLRIDYDVGYVRPLDGATLDTGVGFAAPYVLSLLGGQSVLPTSFDSLAGQRSGSWSYDLDPGQYYSVILAAANIRSYFSPSGLGADQIQATYVVTLPSFAAPVPEPAPAALLLAGLAMLGCLRRRRRTGSAA